MLSDALVSINILFYNGEEHVKPCLNSVFKQSYTNIEILMLDNNSTDGTISVLKQFLRNLDVPKDKFKLIANEKNLGFAGGHNRGIKESRGEFVLILGQDVVLDKDFVKNAVQIFGKDSRIGAVQGKIFKSKVNFRPEPRPKESQKLKVIDTTGLVILKNRRVINRGQGEIDKGQYDREGEVFGADGAAAMYRREALKDMKISMNSEPEYFDEDFFIYKEDIDLAWRMRLYGWKTMYTPTAVAFHERSGGEIAAISDSAILEERKKLSPKIKYYSWKNQRLMQIKNELLSPFFKDLPSILIKELKTALYILTFEPYVVKSVIKFFIQAPRAFQKRLIIMKNKKASAEEMGQWFQ